MSACFGRAGAVGVDHDQLGAARLPRRAICVMTLTWVATGLPPHTTIRSLSAISRESTPRMTPPPACQPASDSETQIVLFWREYFISWRQAEDAVALHQAHRAGVVIGIDRLGCRPSLLGALELFGDLIQRLVPS